MCTAKYRQYSVRMGGEGRGVGIWKELLQVWVWTGMQVRVIQSCTSSSLVIDVDDGSSEQGIYELMPADSGRFPSPARLRFLLVGAAHPLLLGHTRIMGDEQIEANGPGPQKTRSGFPGETPA